MLATIRVYTRLQKTDYLTIPSSRACLLCRGFTANAPPQFRAFTMLEAIYR